MERNLFNKKRNIVGVLKYSSADHDKLSKLSIHKTSDGYAKTKHKGRNILIHRFVLNYNGELEVDHINQDKLDCRRENLRILTHGENSQNIKKILTSDSTSNYKGVSITKNGKFRSRIKINRKEIQIGTFENELLAAQAYDKYILNYNSDNESQLYHSLNFPHTKYEICDKIITKKKKKYNGAIRLKNGKYKAYTRINGKSKYISTCNSEYEALKAHDQFVVRCSLDKKLNFPEDHQTFFCEKKIKTLYEPTDDSSIIRLLVGKNSDNVLIDKNDYDKIKYLKLCISRKDKYYVYCGEETSLHRLIMNASSDVIIDHINSDGLDNRQCNLRISDTEKNAHNRKKSSGTSSCYIGVSKYHSKWQSYVSNKCKKIYLGSFDTEEKAARVRDEYILKNFPDEHYKLNF